MSIYRFQTLAAHDPHCVFQAECAAGEEAVLQGLDLTDSQLVDWMEIFLAEGSASCYCHTDENGYEGWNYYKPGLCKCGCGEAAARHYRLGHDARHVAKVVAGFLEGLEYGYTSVTREQALAALPTPALVRKADARITAALAR